MGSEGWAVKNRFLNTDNGRMLSFFSFFGGDFFLFELFIFFFRIRFAVNEKLKAITRNFVKKNDLSIRYFLSFKLVIDVRDLMKIGE